MKCILAIALFTFAITAAGLVAPAEAAPPVIKTDPVDSNYSSPVESISISPGAAVITVKVSYGYQPTWTIDFSKCPVTFDGAVIDSPIALAAKIASHGYVRVDLTGDFLSSWIATKATFASGKRPPAAIQRPGGGAAVQMQPTECRGSAIRSTACAGSTASTGCSGSNNHRWQPFAGFFRR